MKKLVRVNRPLAKQIEYSREMRSTYGSVYIGQDPFGTGTRLVRISLVFARDLVDRICYLVPNGSTYEGYPVWNRTVLV